MDTVTILKNITSQGDLVVLPRILYERLLRSSFSKRKDWIYDEPYKSFLKNRIRLAENEFKKGKTVTWTNK